MGSQKKLFAKAVKAAWDRGALKGGRLGKILVVFVALAVVLFAGAMVMVFIIVGWAADVLDGRPDTDLVAMERAVASGGIVLTADQKRALAPIVEQLAREDLPPERRAGLKEELWRMLPAGQVDEIRRQQEELSRKAGRLFAIPPGMVALLEKYTGITVETVREKIDELLAWWQVNRPANSAWELRRTLERT